MMEFGSVCAACFVAQPESSDQDVIESQASGQTMDVDRDPWTAEVKEHVLSDRRLACRLRMG